MSFLLSVLFMSASATAGGTTDPAVAPATNPAESDLDKVICKRQEETGSRLGARKVCRTRAEWKIEAETARTTMRRIQAPKHGLNGS